MASLGKMLGVNYRKNTGNSPFQKLYGTAGKVSTNEARADAASPKMGTNRFGRELKAGSDEFKIAKRGGIGDIARAGKR